MELPYFLPSVDFPEVLLILQGAIEVKARDGATPSLNKLIDGEKYADVRFGIKFGYKNVGFNGRFYTFPYFLAFFLKRFLRETKS